MSKKYIMKKILIILIVLALIICLQRQQGLAFFEKGGRNTFVYDAQKRPDPFVPLLDNEGDIKYTELSHNDEFIRRIKKIEVNGVFWDEDMPLVMINNKILKQGDLIEGLTVITINEENVEFKFFDLTHTVSLIEKKKINGLGGINEIH